MTDHPSPSSPGTEPRDTASEEEAIESEALDKIKALYRWADDASNGGMGQRDFRREDAETFAQAQDGIRTLENAIAGRARASSPPPLERLAARYAYLCHLTNEGDEDCDGSDRPWCDGCWQMGLDFINPATTTAGFIDADREYARLSDPDTRTASEEERR